MHKRRIKVDYYMQTRDYSVLSREMAMISGDNLAPGREKSPEVFTQCLYSLLHLIQFSPLPHLNSNKAGKRAVEKSSTGLFQILYFFFLLSFALITVWSFAVITWIVFFWRFFFANLLLLKLIFLRIFLWLKDFCLFLHKKAIWD